MSSTWSSASQTVTERAEAFSRDIFTKATAGELGTSGLIIAGGLGTGIVCFKKAWNLSWSENAAKKAGFIALGLAGIGVAGYEVASYWMQAGEAVTAHQAKVVMCNDLKKNVQNACTEYRSGTFLNMFNFYKCSEIADKKPAFSGKLHEQGCIE